jgi:peptidoglycan/LPS O-acetylase OafA/YrhL
MRAGTSGEPAAAGASSVAHSAYLAIVRFASLDGLRCLAILPVIWHHSTPRPLEGVLGRGPLGVHLFFAISGFLITTLLLAERRASGAISLGGFFTRRALRIFPLYYAVLALYVARAVWLLPDSPMRAHFLRNIPYFATYTTNWLVDFGVPHPVIFGFSWSLATEGQFYLGWPWVVRAGRTLRAPVLSAVALLALDSAAEHGLFSAVLGTDGVLLRVATSISAPICLGSLLACALHSPGSFRVLAPLLGHAASAPLALATLVLLVAIDGTPLLAIHVAMVALVGAVCVRPEHGLRRLLEARGLTHIGAVSYGMYLFHVAAITLVKRLLPPAWRVAPAIFVLATVVTLAWASFSYRHYERPFLLLRSRFRSARPRPGG